MSVRDNLAAGKYANTVPFDIEKIPVDEDRMSVKQARDHLEAEKQRQRAQRRLYQENEGRMGDLLRSDLEAENDVAGHPKAGKLWSLAWEHGHGSGYAEVIGYYEEFVELLQ
jgi:hypothetical protein